MAKAGSFSKHARRRRPRFALKAQSAPEDELSSDLITSGRQPTLRTLMPALAQGLRDVGTARTVLRRATRINLHQHPTSVFGFVGELIDEGRPTSIVDRLRQPPGGQSFDVQIFDRDQAVA